MSGLIKNIFDTTISGLERQMDLTYARNQALTSNIANATTPQYRAVDVNFGLELERAFNKAEEPLLRTNKNHMDVSSLEGPHTVADYSGVTRADGNNVDLDLQMGRLASNSSAYGGAVNLIRKKLGLIRTAIREAGR